MTERARDGPEGSPAGDRDAAAGRTDGGESPPSGEADATSRRADGGSPPPKDLPDCDEAGCTRRAAVRLHVPWSDDRAVCAAHARVLARPDGVVAEPIEGAEAEWP